MSQFAKEGAAYQPVDHQGKACEGAACAGARVSRTGKIKTRCMNKSNAVLGATLGLLAAVTVLTFVLMDYGDHLFWRQRQMLWATLQPCLRSQDSAGISPFPI
mgnify:CR=1 FL=1